MTQKKKLDRLRQDLLRELDKVENPKMSNDKMRHDLDRIMLEGNTAFQQLRLRADALEEENKKLREALREVVDGHPTDNARAALEDK